MIVLSLSLIGALILLDKYAIGEFGISHPIFAGTIIGAIFGDLQSGIFIGALFQLVFLANLPIGREIPLDAQGGGITGCGSYFILNYGNQSEANLLIAFLIGMLGAIIGRFLDIYARRLNEQLYYQFLRTNKKLAFYHFGGMITSFFRGLILFLILFTLVYFFQFFSFALQVDRWLFGIIVVSLGMANGLYLYLKNKGIYFFIMGLICTLVYFVL